MSAANPPPPASHPGRHTGPPPSAGSDPTVDVSLLNEVAASVDAIVWSADTEGRFLYLNSAAERLTGFSLKTFLDDPHAWRNRIHPEDVERVYVMFASPHTDGVRNARYRFLNSAGEYRTFKMFGRVHCDDTGTPVRVAGVTVDVTDHDRRDEELHAALDEARAYRNLFTNANAMAAITDFQGHFTLLSPAWRSVMGYEPRNLVGRSVLDIIHADDVEAASAALRALVTEGEEVSSLEIRFRCYDRSYRWLLWNVTADPDSERLYGVAQDVSERRLAELVVKETTAALQTSEQRLRAMASEVPGVIYQFRMRSDGTFEFPYVSEGLRRLFHLEPRDVYLDASLIWTHVEPAQLEGLLASIVQSARNLVPWVYDFDVQLPGGERRRVHGASRPQPEPDGSTLWSGLLTDVTAQRAQEEALVHAREAALAASREKSQFLANMSHEIRTPMNGILGMTELALGTALSDEQREYLETVRQSAETLLGILNDILDLSKIEARHITLERVPFALRHAVDEAVGLLMPRAHEKGLAVSVDVDPGVAERVLGDPLRLGQVLRNFFANAVKFTRAGSVAVRVAPEPDGVMTRFSVTDTGVGIAPGDLNRIFDPFAQSDSSTTRRYGGTGLGLSIARQLATLMGGRVWVESTLDHGSTFHIAVPLPEAPAGASTVSSMSRLATAPAPGPFASLGLRVLVVEDNLINARVVARMLQRLGCEVEGADTGLAALDVAALERFDVVLMDIQMPDLDGFETTRRLRAREEGTGVHVPVVALTANAMKGDEQRCLDAGMDGYLAKPIAVDRLEFELRRVTGQNLPLSAD